MSTFMQLHVENENFQIEISHSYHACGIERLR